MTMKDSQSTTTNALDDSVITNITLQGTTLGGTHVGAIPLTSIPNLNAIVDCTAQPTLCSNLGGRTLADLVGSFRPTATFGDLGSALNTIKLAWLVEPFLDKSSFDWEFVPKASIPLAAYPNREVLQADVDINCLQSAGTTFGTFSYDYASDPGKIHETYPDGTQVTYATDDTGKGTIVNSHI